MRTVSQFDGEHLNLVWEVAAGFGEGTLTTASGARTGRGERRPNGSYASMLAGRIACD